MCQFLGDPGAVSRSTRTGIDLGVGHRSSTPGPGDRFAVMIRWVSTGCGRAQLPHW